MTKIETKEKITKKGKKRQRQQQPVYPHSQAHKTNQKRKSNQRIGMCAMQFIFARFVWNRERAEADQTQMYRLHDFGVLGFGIQIKRL